MDDHERQYMIVTTPFLFCNFVECETKDQRSRNIVVRVKSAVKWVLNWKGYRDR